MHDGEADRILRMIAVCAVLAFSVRVGAAPLDATADAVVGQPDFASFDQNQPASMPTAANLWLSNAAHLALAPDGRIYVSDAENHRVLSWPDSSVFANGAPADLVIGQPDFTSNAANRDRFPGTSADAFYLPQGLHVDEAGRLWVADAFNHRVLRFPNPTISGAADLVIGQTDLLSNAPNLGLGDANDNPATALHDSLLYPGRVIVRGDDVWISDSGNSRVLHYTAPSGNNPIADLVLGQYGDFTRRAKNNDGKGNHTYTNPTADNLFNCIGIALDAYGNLYVADWINYRVLRFDDPLHTDTTADAVFGQPDFTSRNVNNNGQLASGFNLPIDVFVDLAGALFVADSANHRLLAFHDPLYDQSTPNAVFGQHGSFTANDINGGLGWESSDADGLHAPTALALDDALNLFVTDTNNNRVLRFDMVRGATAAADFDLNGEVDAADFARLQECLARPTMMASTSCRVPDLDHDLDVDLADFAIWQRCVPRSGEPVDENCAN